MRASPVLAMAVLSGLLALELEASAAPSASRLCTSRKIVAMARAHACLLKQDERALAGSVADYARCQAKFEKSFTRLDASGRCTVTGDAAAAYARVTHTQPTLASELFDAVSASADPSRCAARLLRIAAQYGKCQGAYVSNSLRLESFLHPVRCDEELLTQVLDLHEPSGECTFDWYVIDVPIRASAERLSNYFPSGNFSDVDLQEVVFESGDFTNADFSNASFFRTDFDGSDMTGATFAGASGSIVLNRTNLAGADFSGMTVLVATAGHLVACPAALPAGWLCIDNHVVGPLMIAEGYDLSGADLEGLDFSQADFAHSDFSGASLRNANLEYANLRYGNLSGADLTNANLLHAEIEGANFDFADLAGVDWSFQPAYDGYGPRISGRNLANCPAAINPLLEIACVNGTLRGKRSTLDGLDFSGMDLSSQDLDSSSMRATNFTGANLSGANLSGSFYLLSDLTDAILVNADVSGAGLGDSFMTGTNCSESDFTSSSFYNALMSNVDFTGADLTGTDFTSAELYGTVWSGTICPDGSLSDANGNTCCGHFLMFDAPDHCE